MNIIQIKVLVLLFIALAFPHTGSAQDSLTFELKYEVNRIYPPISITRERLNEANTLVDLNRYFKSSWVREFISVEIMTSHEGRIVKAVSKNDSLTQKQNDIMNMAMIYRRHLA